MTPEDIAKLIAAQSVEAMPAVIEDTIVPEPKNEPAATSDGMITQDQIAALFDTQSDTVTSEDIASLIAAQSVEETPTVIEEPILAEPELEPKNEPAASNGMMTPEDIANLIATQSVEETPFVSEEPIVAEPQPEPEPKKEPAVASNGMMTPEDIANLIASQSVEETPAVNEETVVPESKNEPAAASNGMMTPEDIAKLIAGQSVEETPSVIEEPIVAEPQLEPEPEPKKEPEASSDGMITQDQIAALFDTQSDTVTSEEQSSSANETIEVEEKPAVIEKPIVAEPELEPKKEPAASSDGMITQDQIAALFNTQSDTEASEEASAELSDLPKEDNVLEEIMPSAEGSIIPEAELPSESDSGQSIAKEKSNIVSRFITSFKALLSRRNRQNKATKEPKNEPTTSSDGMLTPDQSAALLNTQSDTEYSEGELASELDSGQSLAKEKSNIASRLITSFKKLLSRKNRQNKATKETSEALVEQITADESLDKIEQDETVSGLEEKEEAVLDSPVKSAKGKKAKKTKGQKIKPPKKQKTEKSRSGLKVALAILGVSILMSGSFVAGNISRDYISLFKPDPAKVAAQAEEKAKLAEEQAKEAENKKRAEELAAINPKDYTSSMYLDSIIIKGQADKMTSIKLKKIDNISKLSQFTKLRRIRLYDMKGDEDLSVIQQLNGVEEIQIENSVLKSQFSHGDFKSVTYVDMIDCTINDSTQFANFKNVTEFSADATKFVTKDGNLKITSYLPSLETLTLNSCGEYGELVGVQNLKRLKTLELSNNTIVKNMSYVQNPQIETLTVDISFIKSIDQLITLSKLKNLNTLFLQFGKSSLSSDDVNAAIDLIVSEHPDIAIKILSN